MDSLSRNILSVLLPFSVLFSKPSWKKAHTLLLGAIICIGKRTVCSALRAMGLSEETAFAKYHHVLNRCDWSLLSAARILFFMLLQLSSGPIVLLVDETLERRKGKKIKAKGYYRDAVRSSKSQVVKTTGLKWLVMALSVRFPFIPRALALPFMSVLEFSKRYDEEKKKRHKTTLKWTIQMIYQVRRWVGKCKEVILVGDGGFAAGLLALKCIVLEVTLVTRLKINAALFDFPKENASGKRGRKPLKGTKLKNFKEMLSLQGFPWKEMEIMGYNGIKKTVRFISNTCMWGADGVVPIPIRWVLIVDPTGEMDPLPLMSTNPGMSPKQIIELYVDRWGLEVTFEETREHLGVETQRQWSDKAIARSTPILMALYSLICLMGHRIAQEKSIPIRQAAWYQKEHVTFSDILRVVRGCVWRENLISRKGEIWPSVENFPQKMSDFVESIVQVLLQAA